MSSSSSSGNTMVLDDGFKGPNAPGGESSLSLKYDKPPFWAQQLNKAATVLLNAGLVAIIRGWTNPPKLEAPPPSAEGGVPQWFTEDYQQRAVNQLRRSRVMRDTALFAAGCYLMDGVESGMKAVRGQDDEWNRVMGGVAAGGLIGVGWYPHDPRARAILTGVGGLIGYLSSYLEDGSNKFLLRQQQSLEKDLLHKSDTEVRPDLDPWYLRALVRAKQEQAAAARLQSAATEMRQMARDDLRRLGGDLDGEGGGQGGAMGEVGAFGSFASSGVGRAGETAGGNEAGVLMIRDEQGDGADRS